MNNINYPIQFLNITVIFSLTRIYLNGILKKTML